MDKKLLSEYIPFGTINKQTINESIKRNNGKLIVEGVIQRAEAKNHNGRIYPKKILEDQVRKYIDGPVRERRAYGELDHSSASEINLKNVCINIQKLWWEGNDLLGRIEVLSTPSGNIVRSLFEDECTVGISSRALGSIEKLDENTVEVQDDLEIICWDIVSTPSTHGAFITPINENTIRLPKSKYEYVDKIIKELICLNTNSCSL
jgi:hypothetical protein